MNVDQSLDHLAIMAEHQLLVLATHGLLDAPGAAWLPTLPGNGFYFTLQRRHLKQPVPRWFAPPWFAPVGWRDTQSWLKYGLASVYMLGWMRLWDADMPWPQVVRQDQALVIARWIYDALQRHGRCVLHATVSGGLRICVAAREAGLDLTGATLRCGGEPITPAEAQAMEQAGARCVPGYGTVEAGGLGLGCGRPVGVDDVHLATDAFALFTHPLPGTKRAGVTVAAFNLTTLLDEAPKLLLNYQSDDYGLVEERACGCELAACGYTTHLREIRSFIAAHRRGRRC